MANCTDMLAWTYLNLILRTISITLNIVLIVHKALDSGLLIVLQKLLMVSFMEYVDMEVVIIWEYYLSIIHKMDKL